MIVANKVGPDCGFDTEDNTVDVFWCGGEQSFPMTAKTELAGHLIQLIAERYVASETGKTDDKWPRAVR